MGWSGLRGPRRNEVDDAVAGGALLEERLAPQAVEHLRGQGHVAGLASAVGHLSDRRPPLATNGLVTTVQHNWQLLARCFALGSNLAALGLHGAEATGNIAGAGPE